MTWNNFIIGFVSAFVACAMGSIYRRWRHYRGQPCDNSCCVHRYPRLRELSEILDKEAAR